MSKTFTCKELGGICDETFSGETLAEIMQAGGPHMMGDDAHKQSIMSLSQRTGETQDEWMHRMQEEFDARPSDE